MEIQNKEIDHNDEIEEEKEPELKDRATVIGEWLIEKFRTWRPTGAADNELLGQLYGFNCYIARVQAGDHVERDGGTMYSAQGINLKSYNKLYIQHPDGGPKYTWSHGVPERSSPKVAARNWLSALSRCENILKSYSDEKRALEVDINALKSVQEKPFSRQQELEDYKAEVKRLEQQIAAGITGKHQEHSTVDVTYEIVDDEDEIRKWDGEPF